MPFVRPRCFCVTSSTNDDEARADDEERHHDEEGHDVKETQDVKAPAFETFPPSIDEAP